MEKNQKSLARLDFSNVRLYAVSGDVKAPDEFLSTAAKLIEGGIDALQLRSHSLTDRKFIETAVRARQLCEQADVLFLVNDRVDVALAAEAHGVHLGQTNMSLADARKILGYRAVIGASAHSLPQAIEAQRAGADYVSCGPVWATPTKPDYEPVGLKLIGLYKAAIHVPFVAIGGINADNIDQVVGAGAATVAVVRALFNASDPSAAATFFKLKMVGLKENVYGGK